MLILEASPSDSGKHRLAASGYSGSLLRKFTMASPKDTPHKTHPKAIASESVTPPAQHVWLAGLGALAKAQQEGSKAIEALVNDGLAFQRKSQSEAQKRLQEATERLSHMTTDFGQPASGRVDKLEHLFEDRVAKALHRLGMPSLLDVQMLNDRVTQLETQWLAMSGSTGQQDQAAAKKAKPLSKSARQASAKPLVKAVGKTAAKTAAKSAPKTSSASAKKQRNKSA
jgi:poly(hydroxyalkanoate) granule-associated protein